MVASKNISKKIIYAILMLSAIFLVCTDVWAAANNSKPAMVNRIDFVTGEKGAASLVIGTTADVQCDLQTAEGNQLRLVLDNTVIPTYRRKALATSDLDSAVNRIVPVQSQSGSQAYVLIDLKEKVPYQINKTAEGIVIDFAAATGKNIAVAAKPQAEQPKLAVTAQAKPKKISGSISAPQKSAPAQQVSTGATETILSYSTAKKVYTGTSIALDFYETDIRNVIRILQEVSGRNFAVDRDVQGSVTLSFKNPVPWDQVLELILTMNQLSSTDDGTVIRISRVQTVTRESEDRAMAIQRSVVLQDAETKATAFIPVYYAKATDLASIHIEPWLEEVRDNLDGSSSGSSGSRQKPDIIVTADARLNMLVVNAPERIVEQVRGMVRNLDKVTPQVLIEARIIEANSSFTRELGFDWGQISIDPFGLFGGDLSLNFAANNLPNGNPINTGGGTGTINFTGTSFQIINARISAAEQEGLTNILSAPRILTLNTEKAMIKQGMEWPYYERDDTGGSSVQWKDVDLLLEVTPQITLDNRVTLEVYITKNEVDQSTVTTENSEPGIVTNEARTKFMVDDGDTVVIGGILKSTRSHNESGIPGLRKLSLLGWLFQSERINETKNELLIFMSPKIITLENRNSSL